MRFLAVAIVMGFAHFAAAGTETAGRRMGNGVGEAVVAEMNFARAHPRAYAVRVQELRENFRGDICTLSGGTRFRSKEGVRAVDEAIGFLQRATPLPPFFRSSGMTAAAAEHAADQADGSYGHAGSDRSNPGQRLNRYGHWSVRWGENISYGKLCARDIVLALIVDDGQPARKHRQNIFNSDFHFAGAALGPHARYRTVCSIEFAGGYAEGASSLGRNLLAGN